MKSSNVLMAGVALAFLAGGIGSAFAQAQSTGPSDENPYNRKKVSHGHAARSDQQNNTYRPLTVSPTGVAPVDAGVGVADVGLGAAGGILGGVGTGIGDIGSGVGGAIGGAGSLVQAPFAGLSGGSVGISGSAVPPLPIKARYANSGAVADSVDEGFTKPVPVDKSGPIYMLDENATTRAVTPFSLLAFPLTGITSIISSPFRGTTGAL